jgi:hypothetical protein
MDRSVDAISVLGIPQQNYVQHLDYDHNPKSMVECLASCKIYILQIYSITLFVNWNAKKLIPHYLIGILYMAGALSLKLEGFKGCGCAVWTCNKGWTIWVFL